MWKPLWLMSTGRCSEWQETVNAKCSCFNGMNSTIINLYCLTIQKTVETILILLISLVNIHPVFPHLTRSMCLMTEVCHSEATISQKKRNYFLFEGLP